MKVVNLSAGSLVVVVATSQNFILFPRKLQMCPYVHSQAHLRPMPNVMNCTSGLCGALQFFIQILCIIYPSILVPFFLK